MTIVLFIVGLVFLIVGAEALVRGSSRLAVSLGISPLAIGLTVVAFGTSSPELAVSIKAVLSNQAGIAVGNIVGSNIFNTLFILGLSALIAPLIVAKQLIRFDVPLMIALSFLVYFFSFDGRFGRIDGGLLVIGLVIYISFLFYQSRKEIINKPNDNENEMPVGGNWFINLILIAVGLGLLVLGSRWLVDGAVSFARYFGVSELVIGLTIVSAGTSLPEVVTSVIAAIRGERDIAVGNVIGSNLFNIMCVLGIASVVGPNGMEVSPAVTNFDIPVMLGVAIVCLPIFYTGGIISRKEGALLLGSYLIYTLYLILAAAHHSALPMLSDILLYFALPITGVSLLIFSLREVGHKKKIKFH